VSAFQAFILGITQGITEFLPISSDGHLILVPALFGWERFGLGFDVVLHTSTLAATIAYFRKDVWRLAKALFSRAADHARDRRLALFLIYATIPSVIIALAFEPLVDQVETFTMTTQVTIVGPFLLVTAALLGGAEFLAKRVKATKKILLDVIIGGEALPPALPLIVGLATTAVVGYAAIAILLPFVRKHSLAAFAVYTVIVGTAILVWNFVG